MNATKEKTEVEEEEMWADVDVGRFFKVSAKTVLRWAQDIPGFPKPYKIGGTVRWYRSEVLAFRIPLRPPIQKKKK